MLHPAWLNRFFFYQSGSLTRTWGVDVRIDDGGYWRRWKGDTFSISSGVGRPTLEARFERCLLITISRGFAYVASFFARAGERQLRQYMKVWEVLHRAGVKRASRSEERTKASRYVFQFWRGTTDLKLGRSRPLPTRNSIVCPTSPLNVASLLSTAKLRLTQRGRTGE